MYWSDTGNFDEHWKIPHSNDKLIRFAKGILIVSPNTFSTFVGMLLVPKDLFYLEFWLSLEFQLKVQVREKRFDCRGSVKKSEKCLLVFTILPSIFCTIVEKNLLRWLLFRTGFR